MGWIRAIRSVLRGAGRAVKYTALSLLCLYLGLAVWGVAHLHDRRQVCGALPNGLLVGRTAFFDPTPDWDDPAMLLYPTVRLKFPDGDPLIAGGVEHVIFSQTTVYGRAWKLEDARQGYWFAYRPDTGLVLKDEEPERYKKLEEEAGPLIHLDGHPCQCEIPLVEAFHVMIRTPEYRRESCPLDIFPD